jgi:D-amino-acid dehydrogenase
VQPIRLHALTAPLLHEEHAPQFTLVDNKRRIVIARLNHQWIKITGTAVLQSQVKILQGADPALRTQALDRLIQAGYDWAAGAIKFSAANYWDGINLLSPDGLPIVSRTHHPRLYVNLAHGPAGWGLSIGSAALITALLDNRLAKEDRDFAHMLSVDRFSR